LTTLLAMLDKSLRFALALLMTAMVGSVVWQVLSRYLFVVPAAWTEELARFLLIWIGMLGAAYAYRQGSHLGIDLLANKLDVELYVYLNERGRFAKSPSLTHTETIEGSSMQSGGNRTFARFFGDVTGDGVSELLVRSRPENIRLLMVRKRRGTLSLIQRPLHEMKIHKDARIRVLRSNAAHRGFLVLEENQVLLVTF